MSGVRKSAADGVIVADQAAAICPVRLRIFRLRQALRDRVGTPRGRRLCARRAGLFCCAEAGQPALFVYRTFAAEKSGAALLAACAFAADERRLAHLGKTRDLGASLGRLREAALGRARQTTGGDQLRRCHLRRRDVAGRTSAALGCAAVQALAAVELQRLADGRQNGAHVLGADDSATAGVIARPLDEAAHRLVAEATEAASSVHDLVAADLAHEAGSALLDLLCRVADALGRHGLAVLARAAQVVGVVVGDDVEARLRVAAQHADVALVVLVREERSRLGRLGR